MEKIKAVIDVESLLGTYSPIFVAKLGGYILLSDRRFATVPCKDGGKYPVWD